MPQPVQYRGMTLIVPDNDSEWTEFYAHARAHRLVVRKCTACGLMRYPPTHACPWCMELEWTWQELSARGTIYSYEIVHHAIQPCFRELTPHPVVLVELALSLRPFHLLPADPAARPGRRRRRGHDARDGVPAPAPPPPRRGRRAARDARRDRRGPLRLRRRPRLSGRRERGDGAGPEGARRAARRRARGDRASLERRARHLPRHALPPARRAHLDASAPAPAAARLARGEQRRRRPARRPARRRLAAESPRHAPDTRAPAGTLPEHPPRARPSRRDRDAADQGVLRRTGVVRGVRGSRGVPRREVPRVPALGAGQGAARRGELRGELRGAGARPVRPRRPREGRRGDRALPRAARRDDHDPPAPVAGHGQREGPSLDPTPRHEGAPEVPTAVTGRPFRCPADT